MVFKKLDYAFIESYRQEIHNMINMLSYEFIIVMNKIPNKYVMARVKMSSYTN